MLDPDGTVWHSLIMPFRPALWLALVVCLLTLSAFLYFTKKIAHRRGAKLEADATFLQSFFFLLSALCCQGKDRYYYFM
jgi:hypothetical protein